MVLKKIFDESLDPECFTYVNGALPETQLLLEQKFDKICFTGGKAVGKIIAQKAAETLTPVLLELGACQSQIGRQTTSVAEISQCRPGLHVSQLHPRRAKCSFSILGGAQQPDAHLLPPRRQKQPRPLPHRQCWPLQPPQEDA
ncbi:hypothetical protein LB505_013211 [Fusarium chuoi]|nr:hypothetical protein LB505_013211 [Fusarium chuoi]